MLGCCGAPHLSCEGMLDGLGWGESTKGMCFFGGGFFPLLFVWTVTGMLFGGEVSGQA